MVRHVRKGLVDDGIVDGSAFERCPKDKDGVSVVRRMVLAKLHDADLQQIRKVVASRMRIGGESFFAEINVGSALVVLREFDNSIRIIKDPLAKNGAKLANPAHALIVDLPLQHEKVGGLLSQVAGDLLARLVIALHPAK